MSFFKEKNNEKRKNLKTGFSRLERFFSIFLIYTFLITILSPFSTGSSLLADTLQDLLDSKKFQGAEMTPYIPRVPNLSEDEYYRMAEDEWLKAVYEGFEVIKGGWEDEVQAEIDRLVSTQLFDSTELEGRMDTAEAAWEQDVNFYIYEQFGNFLTDKFDATRIQQGKDALLKAIDPTAPDIEDNSQKYIEGNAQWDMILNDFFAKETNWINDMNNELTGAPNTWNAAILFMNQQANYYNANNNVTISNFIYQQINQFNSQTDAWLPELTAAFISGVIDFQNKEDAINLLKEDWFTNARAALDILRIGGFDETLVLASIIEANENSATEEQWLNQVQDTLTIVRDNVELAWTIYLEEELEKVTAGAYYSLDQMKQFRTDEITLEKNNAFALWDNEAKELIQEELAKFLKELAATAATEAENNPDTLGDIQNLPPVVNDILIESEINLSAPAFDSGDLLEVMNIAAQSSSSESWWGIVDYSFATLEGNWQMKVDAEINRILFTLPFGERESALEKLYAQKQSEFLKWEAGAKAYIWKEYEIFLQNLPQNQDQNSLSSVRAFDANDQRVKAIILDGVTSTSPEVWTLVVNSGIGALQASWEKRIDTEIESIVSGITDGSSKAQTETSLKEEKAKALEMWQAAARSFVNSEFGNFLNILEAKEENQDSNSESTQTDWEALVLAFEPQAFSSVEKELGYILRYANTVDSEWAWLAIVNSGIDVLRNEKSRLEAEEMERLISLADETSRNTLTDEIIKKRNEARVQWQKDSRLWNLENFAEYLDKKANEERSQLSLSQMELTAIRGFNSNKAGQLILFAAETSSTETQWWRVVENGIARLSALWESEVNKEINSIISAITVSEGETNVDLEIAMRARLDKLLAEKEKAKSSWDASVNAFMREKFAQFVKKLYAESNESTESDENTNPQNQSIISLTPPIFDGESAVVQKIITDSKYSDTLSEWWFSADYGIAYLETLWNRDMESQATSILESLNDGEVTEPLTDEQKAKRIELDREIAEIHAKWKAQVQEYFRNKAYSFIKIKNLNILDDAKKDMQGENQAGALWEISKSINEFYAADSTLSVVENESLSVIAFDDFGKDIFAKIITGYANTTTDGNQWWSVAAAGVNILEQFLNQKIYFEIENATSGITDEDARLMQREKFLIAKAEELAKWRASLDAYLWSGYYQFLGTLSDAASQFNEEDTVITQLIDNANTAGTRDEWWLVVEYGIAQVAKSWSTSPEISQAHARSFFAQKFGGIPGCQGKARHRH